MAHSDAIGYLSDLKNELALPWLQILCDLAAGGAYDLAAADVDVLFAVFCGQASYVRPSDVLSGAPSKGGAAPADFLESLSEFSNFKLIGDALRLDFKKRISLVFGNNGSGKSSLCETLKVLASPDAPVRPLKNVRIAANGATGFKFKFRSDAASVAWSPAIGYGIKQSTVKYFDTTVATQNIKVAVDPGRVIELSPFKLHVFERATALTNRFRQILQKRQRENAGELAASLEALRNTFATFSGRPLATVTEGTVSILDDTITMGECFAAAADLAAKRSAAVDMEKATSEDGLKLLKSEARELNSLLDSLDALAAQAIELARLDPVNKAAALAAKQESQRMLASALVPAGATLDVIKELAKAAAPLCSLDEATGQSCPLCRRAVGDVEVHLFKQYSDLLRGELERDITMLKADLATSTERSKSIGNVAVAEWAKNTTVPAEFLDEAVKLGEAIVAGSNPTEGVKPVALAALDAVALLVAGGRSVLAGKTAAIEAAIKGRGDLLGQLALLRMSIEPLSYAEAVQKALPQLNDARLLAIRAALYTKELTGFQAVLSKITNFAKKAHEALVVADFEARLDREYQRLTERNMAAFGVTLARKGADASVTILPQIGGKDIDGVLSEGEQRVHALALFFAELETCSQSVVIFDDPVSSFDYNYIANYCARLRDFAKDHPNHQIVVLTHNWEFFVNLQTTLNSAKLNNDLAVQVLENCVVVSDYSEDLTELKAEIDAVLALQNEPSRSQKEMLAGNMRVLVEAVVNTHVFAKQRHQYKQKTQKVSNFDEYTKLVPLLPAEASLLRDLYAKLSTSEHHDPRNSYVNTDKAMFQTRYDQIKAIEAAIVARK